MYYVMFLGRAQGPITSVWNGKQFQQELNHVHCRHFAVAR
jgi:hypothetical protein